MVLEGQVSAIELVFGLGESGPAETNLQVAVLPKNSPLGLVRTEFSNRHSQGAAFVTAGARGPVYDQAGSSKFVIHEVMVQLHRELHGLKKLLCRFAARKVRTCVGFALDREIQRHHVVIGRRDVRDLPRSLADNFIGSIA